MKTLVGILLLKATRGAASRLRLHVYRLLGMKMGLRNRMEGGGRVRRCSQIEIGSYNAFTQGAWLWPNDVDYDGIRIRIGNRNYFNRNLMIDACGLIEIGDQNMFGPDVYITDSNHRYGPGLAPNEQPMDAGTSQDRKPLLDWRQSCHLERRRIGRWMRGRGGCSGHEERRAGRSGRRRTG